MNRHIEIYFALKKNKQSFRGKQGAKWLTFGAKILFLLQIGCPFRLRCCKDTTWKTFLILTKKFSTVFITAIAV